MDLSTLRPIFDAAGPYTTVHVDVSRDAEDADHQIDIRRRDVESQLRDHSVPEALVEEVGRRIAEPSGLAGSVRRTIVLGADGVLLDDAQAGVQDAPRSVDHGALPDLLPYLSAADQAVPFVLAVADLTGGDVSSYQAARTGAVAEESVSGEDYYISKIDGVGAEMENRVERLAEENWQANAREVAGEILSQARALPGLPLLLVAGEVQARTELVAAIEHLDAGAAERTHQIDAGGRADGASEEAMWAEVHEVLHRAALDRDADLGSDLSMARGRDEGSREGADDVLEALAKAQVQDVLIEPRLVAERSADPTAFPGLALPVGAASLEEQPLDRVLVAAACLTGAGVSVVNTGVAGPVGVSALLRWTETPPTSEAGRDQG